MKKTIIAFAIAAITATTFGATANAAPIRTALEASTTLGATQIQHRDRRFDRRVLPPRQISRKLRRQGYRNIQNIRLQNHRTYIVRAQGRRGPVRLVVSARSGDVLSRQRLNHRPRHGNRGFTFGGHRGGWSWSYTVR